MSCGARETSVGGGGNVSQAERIPLSRRSKSGPYGGTVCGGGRGARMAEGGEVTFFLNGQKNAWKVTSKSEKRGGNRG